MGKDLKGRELGKCLSQRKDGRYQARFTNRYGQRIEYKDKNLNNVKELIKKEKAKDDLGINSKQNNDTLDMWYLRWKEMAFVDLSEGSTQLYESIYKNQIYPKLGNIKIKDITEFMLRKFFQEQKNYYADSTINGIKNILNQIMQCCKDAKCILYNPVKELKIKKRRKNKNALNVDSKAISIEDEKDLFIYLKGHFYYNMFLFYLTTGLRYGEVAALTVNDIDLKNKVVHINKALKYKKSNNTVYIGPPKTDASYRDVPLNDLACQALENQIELKKKIEKSKFAVANFDSTMRDLLFVTHNNMPVLNGTLDGVLKKARLDINYQREEKDYMISLSVHRLRHTFATRCYENGIPIPVISKYLGHASIATTEEIYVHLLKTHLDAQRIKLNSAFDDPLYRKDDILRKIC